ncbi:MAG: dCTP deaminase [Chloroflexi bacterium]|nr:dCTP deaminase [Chloroflexota bacterium]
MAILSDSSIISALETGRLEISSFIDDALEPASYDMHLHWKMLLSPTRNVIGREIDLRDEPGDTLPLEPGRFAAILTEEIMKLPLDLSGRFGLRSEFTRQGLVAFPGIQVDPGYHGRLAISLFNAGPEDIPLTHMAKMFTIEFHTLETPASHGYDGSYQGQEEFPEDQKQFILNAHSQSLSEIQALPYSLANLEFRVAAHEASHRRSVTFEQLATSQGVEAASDLNSFSEIWPDEDDVDEFLDAVREWRGREG